MMGDPLWSRKSWGGDVIKPSYSNQHRGVDKEYVHVAVKVQAVVALTRMAHTFSQTIHWISCGISSVTIPASR